MHLGLACMAQLPCWQHNSHTYSHTTALSLQTMDVHAARAVYRQNAAVRVQAAWRGTVQRLQLHNQRRAALVIQAQWRGRQVRVALLRQQQAALLLQALWRARAFWRQAARQHQAALQLQAWWKSCACRLRYLRHVAAVVKVLHLPLAQHYCMRPASWLACFK